MSVKKYIVLWVRGGRVGSAPLTKANLEYFHSQFYLGLIQRDVTGTEHYNVMGIKV